MDGLIENNLDKILSEKEITRILLHHLSELGYQAIPEFVLNNKYLKLEDMNSKKSSKVRIDIAAVKDNKITFIEVENGFWVTHPLLYRNFAHRIFLAYPANASSLTDHQQLELAQEYGIGVLKVTSIGSIITELKPIEQSLDTEIANIILSLFRKKITTNK